MGRRRKGIQAEASELPKLLTFEETLALEGSICPSCSAALRYDGDETPSRFPAIRQLGVTRARFVCSACGKRWWQNRSAVEPGCRAAADQGGAEQHRCDSHDRKPGTI